MMENARHLSSPSPTSPFLFHHSERSFKQAPLTPLLSSTVEITNTDDCFSTSSANIGHHQSHNLFAIDHQHSPLVDHNHHNQNHHSGHNHNHHQTSSHNHSRHSDHQCTPIDQDSLTGVDGDDDMHNMLSGSSTSSNSTIPLLAESHSHHSFSRISLEEYSPLSLVDDCDNALPISPTSIACGSHHSFKSSLNGLKMDNLVGDTGLQDHDVHDDVNDARSLSPNLLSASTSNHNNLWSNSSTAITQNVALLNGTSATLLLSQHQHQQQINSLMQQLEPQSLDEPPPPPPLISQGIGLECNSPIAHRPSSEPPPGMEMPKIDVKCPQLKAKQQSSSALKGIDLPIQTISASRPRRSRNRSKSSAARKVSEQERKRAETAHSIVSKGFVHDTKLHLQLNHHKKLKELQQRLFGTSTPCQDTKIVDNNNNNLTSTGDLGKPTQSGLKSKSVNNKSPSSKKEEPDSSAESQEETVGNSRKSVSVRATTTTCKKVSPSTSSDNVSSRPVTRSRRSRKRKNEAHEIDTPLANRSNTKQLSVTAETAEPDTTTKTSDCIKLADLLSNSSSESKNRFILSGIASSNDTNEGVNGEIRRVQQIQLQVSPSLTVVANNGLIQPISVQHSNVNGAVLNTTGPAYSNQILCRTQNVVPSSNSQTKGPLTNGEFKGVDTWSLQTSNGNNSNVVAGSSNIGAGQPIGTHQIAIQVICQDGTSLVLPVSSSASLNAAVSLTSPHPQLQAILANNNTNSGQQRNATNQILPLMSVSNLISQNQTSNSDSRTNTSAATVQVNQAGCTTQISGLAASSPTLAALLDAGTNRNNSSDYTSGCNANGGSSNNHNSNNLLRKLVTGGSTEIKRELTIQPVSTVNMTNCRTSVIVRQQNDTTLNQTTKTGLNSSANGNIEKRIKLENMDVITGPANFVETQGLVVNNNNDKTIKSQSVQVSASNTANTTSSKTSIKQGKVNNNTGNRQVDPTQPFRCEHCNSTFTRLGNFTRHKKIHTIPSKDGQRFKCDVCSKSFLQRCDLARHLHIHRGTEPHRCNICGKLLPYGYILQEIIKIKTLTRFHYIYHRQGLHKAFRSCHPPTFP